MPLQVYLDGALLPEAEARALWARFSEHMEANRGDLAGFAATEGFASVHPEMRDGAPALVASKVARQKPYANAATTSSGGGGKGPSTNRSGSAPHQGSASRDPSKKKFRGTPPKR